MNLFRYLVCTTIAVAGCAADTTTPGDDGTSSAIIGGKKTAADPAVMLLFAGNLSTGDGAICTATLIAPRVLVTAAHCTSTEEVGADAQFMVWSGTDFDGVGEPLEVSSVMHDNAFDVNALQGGHDIGAVILAAPSTITPMAVNTTIDPDTLVGKSVKIVGYGVNNGSKQTGAGVKRIATTTVQSVDDRLIYLGDRKHGTCQGDSGGPAIATLSGVPTLIGVTSFGDVGCTDGGYDTRVDRYASFIASALSRGQR